MAQFEKWFLQDLKKQMDAHYCLVDTVFTADNLSAKVGVRLFEDGVPADQTGNSVMCYCIRADGNTVQFAGSAEGNTVFATLPQSCFAAVGVLAIMLQTISGEGDTAIKTTVLKLFVTVDPSATGSIVDPGHVVPDMAELLAMLDEMEQATEAANAAATKSVRYDTAQELTAEQQAQARANIGTGAPVYYVTVTENWGNYTSDKTCAEIYDACAAGKVVMLQLKRYAWTWFMPLGYASSDNEIGGRVIELQFSRIGKESATKGVYVGMTGQLNGDVETWTFSKYRFTWYE